MNRSDLTDRIPEFIALGEKRLGRDPRLRNIATQDFTAVEDYALPTDFKAIVDIYLDGSSQYGRISVVSPTELAERKLRHGDTGVPRFVAVIDTVAGRTLRFAPEPSSTSSYTVRMVYEEGVDALSDSNTSNWLLDEAHDLYLWAALSATEGYLQEDSRVALWKSEYEQAADEFEKDKNRRQYGGPLTPRPRTIIGEDVRSY